MYQNSSLPYTLPTLCILFVLCLKMARDAISEHLNIKNFLGGHPTDPPSFACLCTLKITPLLKILATGLSYIPQTVTHLLDVTHSNSLPHPLTPPPIRLCVKFKVLVAKQHSTNTHTQCTHTHSYTQFLYHVPEDYFPSHPASLTPS